jgi:hypothetical protein
VSRRLSLAGGLVLLVGCIGLSAAALRAGDVRYPVVAGPSRGLLLRSGAVARRAALSFDALAADVYWIRTIQHYGRDRKSARLSGRFELLAPLLDLTTSLDPDFNIAYRFGAVFLAQPFPSGPGRPDLAIALLQKGLRATPDRWQYAFDIGFLHYWYGTGEHTADADAVEAAGWFERAAAMPRAPVWLKQLAATTRAEGGDTATARRLLSELTGSEEEWLRRAAERALAQLDAVDTIARLQRRLEQYVAEHHALPGSWGALDPGAPPNAVPVDPAGVPYQFDRASRTITLGPSSPLAPLPRTMSAK